SLWAGVFFDQLIITIGACITLALGYYIPMRLYGQPYVFGYICDAADFLGITLLITDPATSPKGRVAKFLFGLTYGAFMFLTYVILVNANTVTAVGKILPIPFMNL